MSSKAEANSPPSAGEPAWPVALLFPRQGSWTEADYLALNTNHLVELSGGVLEVPDMPTNRHQAIVAFLFTRLLAFVTARSLGTVRFSPLPVRLWPGKFREPDVIFMSAAHKGRIGDAYWGVPDLVMEVVSPGNRRLDENIKLREYAEAGIPEYWIVDPESQTISVHAASDEGYVPAASQSKSGTVRSLTLTGFEVEAAEVFAAD